MKERKGRKKERKGRKKERKIEIMKDRREEAQLVQKTDRRGRKESSEGCCCS